MDKSKKAEQRIEWQDACILMHTALRKSCDSKVTSAAYNLIHLITDTTPWSAWRTLGELVAEFVNKGDKPSSALCKAIAALEDAFHKKCADARQKDERIPDNARNWLYALSCTLQCFSKEDIEGMASYLDG